MAAGFECLRLCRKLFSLPGVLAEVVVFGVLLPLVAGTAAGSEEEVEEEERTALRRPLKKRILSVSGSSHCAEERAHP